MIIDKVSYLKKKKKNEWVFRINLQISNFIPNSTSIITFRLLFCTVPTGKILIKFLNIFLCFANISNVYFN